MQKGVQHDHTANVAIPLEQGLFFNGDNVTSARIDTRRNPFGAGTIF